MVGWAIAVELTLLCAIVYSPLGNRLFATSPLPLQVWAPLAVAAVALFIAERLRQPSVGNA